VKVVLIIIQLNTVGEGDEKRSLILKT